MGKLLRRDSSTTAPPSYDSSSLELPPPFVEFPTSYRIGNKDGSLVPVERVKQHLKLLGAFHLLRQSVEGLTTGWAGHLEPKARWGVFVSVSVNRFELYLDSLNVAGGVGGDLPLDVALVLHSYLLNPQEFQEDSARGVVPLNGLQDILLEQVATSIDASTLKQTINEASAAEWKSSTKTLFDPLLNFAATKGCNVKDPKTGATVLVPWVAPAGAGFAQSNFTLATGSKSYISHETPGIAKFAQDLFNTTTGSVLAGTVSIVGKDAKGYDTSRSTKVNSALATQAIMKVAKKSSDIGEYLKWSRSGAVTLLSTAVGVRNARAVIRQGVFIDKMHELKWLEPDRFIEDDSLLKRSIARYHAFMDLLSSTPSMFCVPTLDIDLAWHTHQLSSHYKSDCFTYVGRWVGHDDKVEENALAVSYDVTARVWQSRFGVPYSTCGCLLPSQPPRPFSRLANKLGLSSPAPNIYPSAALTTISPSPDDADATHASEHNSLVLHSHPEAVKRRAARAKELEVRKKRSAKEEQKNAKQSEKNGGTYDEAAEQRRRDHDAAFYAPMPLYAYGPIGYPVPIGGCAYVGGNHADGGGNGSGACATSVGGCASAGAVGACGSSAGGCASSCGGSSGGGCGGGGGGGGCGGGGGGCGGGGS